MERKNFARTRSSFVVLRKYELHYVIFGEMCFESVALKIIDNFVGCTWGTRFAVAVIRMLLSSKIMRDELLLVYDEIYTYLWNNSWIFPEIQNFIATNTFELLCVNVIEL